MVMAMVMTVHHLNIRPAIVNNVIITHLFTPRRSVMPKDTAAWKHLIKVMALAIHGNMTIHHVNIRLAIVNNVIITHLLIPNRSVML
jgi:hypothetical protein